MSQPALPRPSLRLRMLNAAKWVVIGSAAMHVLRLLTNLAMTRLLAPEMFGLMAIATTVGVIMSMLSDVGLRQAVIRSPRGDDPIFLDTVWTIELIRGLVLWGGSLCVAGALYAVNHFGFVSAASTYGNPTLPPLIAASGFVSVIIGTASTLNLSASRRLDTKLIFMLDIVSTLVGLCVMLLCAWFTRSIWSLVIGSVASTICGVTLSHAFMPGRTNRVRLDRASVAEIVGFGKWVVLSSAITVFAMNSDRLVLGAMVNAHDIGLYSIALSLVGAVNLILSQLIDKVMLPAFGEVVLKNPAGLSDAYFRLRRFLDPVILFISGVLFAAGPLIISILYDPRYADAGAIMSILSVGMVIERYALAQQVYLVINKPNYLAPINLARLFSIFTLLPLGYLVGGFKGAVLAIALRDLPVLPIIFWFNSRHGLNKIRMELIFLLFWPAGFAVATLLSLVVTSIRH